MIVFSMNTVVITYDAADRILMQKWIGFSPSETFRLAIDKTVDFVRSHHVMGILNDTYEQGAVAPEDGLYAANVMPDLFQNGLRGMAIIAPQKSTTRLAIDRFQKNSTEAEEKVRTFVDLEEALVWLRSFSG